MSHFFPNFYYKECCFKELDTFICQQHSIPFPVIIKPAVGYSSLGVYRIERAEDWFQTIHQMKMDAEEAKNMYPDTVFDMNRIIIEEWIKGTEYAVDAYYDEQGKPVVLNIFKRMFASDNDTSDQIYYTSKEVLQESIDTIKQFLQSIAQCWESQHISLQRVPLHLELRITDHGESIPIEINPLRFSGIGTSELGYFAYNVNPYSYFFLQKKPDWDQIIYSMDSSIYSFYCAELPLHEKQLANFSLFESNLSNYLNHVLDFRPIHSLKDKTFAVVFFKSHSLDENEKIIGVKAIDILKPPIPAIPT